jgi:hypothetical protein
MLLSLKRHARAVTMAVAATAVAATALFAAPAANADAINQWSSFWQPCGTYLCLYYSQALANGAFVPTGTSYSDLNYYKFVNVGVGTAGVGQVVGNNAASMGNNTINCNVATYYYKNFSYGGNYSLENWLSPGHAGNLTSTMRNNDRSINVNNCT